jgi:phosphate transport system substrate-binding protein
MKIRFILPVFCAAGILFSAGFTHAADKELLGAGATFPYPLYSKMFSVYHDRYGVQVNYQAIGSGGGIRQLFSRTVDFGGSDAFLSDEELASAPAEILHVPTCLGAVVISYNLPGNPALRFTPDIIADIFLGRIRKWNDQRIRAANPGVSLPGSGIFVVHRSDGSGTTFIFSDYLSKVSSDWEKSVGRGTSLNWPVGLGAKGNPGVAGLVKQTPGAIGYVELIYALQNGMPVGLVRNRSGNFIQPSIASVSLAADATIPADTRVSLTDTRAPDGYPISSFTWIIFYKEQDYGNRSSARAEELVRLLWWITHDGQSLAAPLEYAPLPGQAVTRAEAVIMSARYDGKPLTP